MGHRYLSNQFMMSGLDKCENNHSPAEQPPYIPMDGPFAVRAVAAEDRPFVAPMVHRVRDGEHSNSNWDLGGRSNERHSSYASMEVQLPLPPPYSRSLAGPYTHSSTNGNMSLAPTGAVGHIHSSHDNFPVTGDVTAGNGGPYKRKTPGIFEASSNSFYGEGSSSSSHLLIESPAANHINLLGHIHSSHENLPVTGDITAGNGGSYKRKTPGIFEASSNSFYGEGSSSSSHMLIERPANRLNPPPYMGASLSVDDQDSFRNVRSRSKPELEPCMTRAIVPSYASHYYQPRPNSVNYSVPAHPDNLSADVRSGEWNSASYHASSDGRNLPPDINGSRHGTNWSCAGGSSVDNNAYHHNYLLDSSSRPHVSYAQPSRDECNYRSRRLTPLYMNGPSYFSYKHDGRSSASDLRFPLENFSSRHSTPPPAGRGSNYRSGRPRIAANVRERLQPIVNVLDSHDDGFGHENITVDQSSFYHNSRSFPDQYQHMRLDIDNMSYEELLALEESIGDVSTGLSEDGIAKCLREKVYYSMDQNHEATCPICLEEYKNGEKVGRMEKCGHEYHVDCIKKWLLMKKVCPICKSESSTQ